MLKYASELRAEIVLDLDHKPPGMRFEIGILDTVLDRHGEAELMAVTIAALKEGLAIGLVVVPPVEFANGVVEHH